MIVSFMNQKGGVGKTTLALNVAGVLAQRGRRVLVVDGDLDQHTALDWQTMRLADDQQVPLFTVAGSPSAAIHRQIAGLGEGYDDVILDAPPRGQEDGVVRSIALASQLAVIPVEPSAFDIWATRNIVNLLRDAQGFNEGLRAVFVVNRCIVNTALGRQVRSALEPYGLPILNTVVHQRIALAEAKGSGRVVTETNPQELAAAEVTALTDEIMQWHATAVATAR